MLLNLLYNLWCSQNVAIIITNIMIVITITHYHHHHHNGYMQPLVLAKRCWQKLVPCCEVTP